MNKPNIQTTKQVVPMIYGYSTPEVIRHNGWTKIGYTEQNVETRIKQQTYTADIRWHLEWKGNATFDDGSGETFIDKDFHAYLRKSGVEQENGKNNEWFHVDGPTSKQMFRDFRENHGILKTADDVIPYKLREEQQCAVAMTVDYRATHTNGEFLWNAKPRFGKTLSVYDFVQKINAEKVLIVTNRPAIANSWYSDYVKFLGSESGYFFVSEVDALKGRRSVLTRKEYVDHLFFDDDETVKCIEFVSLQDMKGSIYFGGQYDKLGEVANMEWDILVIDEAHEGVDTYKTDVAFDRIKRKFTLHLSGTPFKALANNKFADDAIYNWTYADEQKKKRDWDVSAEEENPYATLPQLNLYTYQMSEIIKDELQQGIEIDGETEEYAFDLNEFFSVTNGKFNHESSVDKFLDAMTRQTKFPFSTEELRKELKHTFWLLDRVDSAKALAKKLKEHPVFKEYEIVLAAGDGKLDDEDETMKSYDKVVAAIAEHEKTITLSVGQLTTGITIPEWTAVLMLSNMRSPALYMQAAFRAQNPCLFKVGTQDVFGDKIYDVTSQVQETMTQMEQAPDRAQKAIEKLKEAVKQSAVKAVVDTAQSTYGSDMKAADKRQIESKLNHEADRMIDKLHTNYEIERNVIENQRVAEQQARYETGKTSEQIDKEFEQKQKAAMEKFNEELTTAISDFAKESTKETVKTVETKKKEREKETIEDGVRDHLRGFSRTIPSFLMAYGDNTVTLATFDTIIPDKVFLEVTSITLDQFKFLRDGGDYVEEETGQTKHFDGQLFDSVVFDDSVKEFLALKKKLADYFDEKSVEDIFDYIPPQKTNQIY